MQMDRLYPPGKVWWAVRADSDTHSKATSSGEHHNTIDHVRLYEVLDVEKVFGQVIFAKDMLRYASTCSRQRIGWTDHNSSSHMPQTYDRVLQQLHP